MAREPNICEKRHDKKKTELKQALSALSGKQEGKQNRECIGQEQVEDTHSPPQEIRHTLRWRAE